MRLLILFSIAGFIHVSAASYSQTVTLSGKGIPLADVLRAVRQQTRYAVFVNMDYLDKTKPVTVNAQDMPLADFLDVVLKDQSLSYSMDDKTIFISIKFTDVSSHMEITRHPELDSRYQQPITGRIVDNTGTGIRGVTIRVVDAKRGIFTDAEGRFSLAASDGNVVTVSAVGYLGLKFRVVSSDRPDSLSRLPTDKSRPAFRADFIASDHPSTDKKTIIGYKDSLKERTAGSFVQNTDNGLLIILAPNVSSLEEVQVEVSTGYQTTSKERATGSFEKANNATINRAVSPDILSRLDGNFSAFSNNINNGAGRTVRGINSLGSSSFPLVVVDNFPYDGDINNINPNDVESVTLLKDAAASSIWGSIAGNGVLVITTKKGSYNQKTKVSLNSNLTITTKPDLLKNQRISTSDYINLEKYLFNQGAYDGDLTNTYNYPIISPVIQILQKQRDNQISKLDADTQIDQLRGNDVRNDYSKYLYHNSVNQQYSLAISGGSEKFNYRTSVGFDKDLNTLVGNGYNRTSFNTTLNFNPIKRLEITTGTVFTGSSTTNNSIGSEIEIGSNYGSRRLLYPYASFKDNDGNPESFQSFNSGFTDIPGSNNLLNWSYNPINEIGYANNKNTLKDLLLSIKAKYSILPGLSLSVSGQHEDQILKSNNYHNADSYFARDLFNVYTSVSDGVVSHAIPNGGTLDNSDGDLISNSARGQLNFDKTFLEKHQISVLAGAEVKQQSRYAHSSTTFGYNGDNLTHVSVDAATPQPSFNDMFGTINVDDGIKYSETLNRFVSYFANASYMFDDRYVLSGSVRKDESNLFGVETNQKGLPLYSAGLAWDISKEKFFNFPFITSLKLKATIGSGGIINNNVAALTTLLYQGNTTYYGLPYNQISNYPNPELKYEQVNQKNIGIDFVLKNNILSGNIDLYSKKSIDLVSSIPFDITSGTAYLTKNSADMTNNGFDVTINSLNINGKFKWRTSLLFSKNTTIITKVYDFASSGSYVGTGGSVSIARKEGVSPYSLFTYKFGGLDPQTGDPLGYINGKVSKDYQAILAQATWDDVSIHGSSVPTVFGTFRNSFEYKNIEASFSIGYRFNYFFGRTNTIDYSGVLTGVLPSQEFANRWQKPGDESKTSVPSMVYPFDSNRDTFYRNSDAIIEKADNIRLNDVQLSYSFNLYKDKAHFGNSITIYGYASNLAILWNATKTNLDPDTRSGIPVSKSISLGCKFNF